MESSASAGIASTGRPSRQVASCRELSADPAAAAVTTEAAAPTGRNGRAMAAPAAEDAAAAAEAPTGRNGRATAAPAAGDAPTTAEEAFPAAPHDTADGGPDKYATSTPCIMPCCSHSLAASSSHEDGDGDEDRDADWSDEGREKATGVTEGSSSREASLPPPLVPSPLLPPWVPKGMMEGGVAPLPWLPHRSCNSRH